SRRWLRFPALDRTREHHGLGEGRHSQLAVQNPLTLVKLAERGDAIAGAGMNPHERAMGRLVDRIELEPSLRVDDRSLRVLARGEPLEDPRELPPEGFG